MRVTGKTSVDVWDHWRIVAELGGVTYVVRGPFSIIVTGDLGSIIFERPGGLGLGFGANGIAYVAEKCATDNAWAYDGDLARTELTAAVREEFFGNVLDDALERLDEIDFDDPTDAAEWYHVETGGGEWVDFGRVPSPTLTRALDCIALVRDFEAAQP